MGNINLEIMTKLGKFLTKEAETFFNFTTDIVNRRLKPATFDNMVECTLCEMCIHNECAKVGDSVVQDETWRCKFCAMAPTPRKNVQKPDVEPGPSKQPTGKSCAEELIDFLH